jgi:hypothetical protein
MTVPSLMELSAQTAVTAMASPTNLPEEVLEYLLQVMDTGFLRQAAFLRGHHDQAVEAINSLDNYHLNDPGHVQPLIDRHSDLFASCEQTCEYIVYARTAVCELQDDQWRTYYMEQLEQFENDIRAFQANIGIELAMLQAFLGL